MLGPVVSGLRTWIWTIAAPAFAAAMPDSAICLGVTGTAGFLPGVSAAPVRAQAIMTLRAIEASFSGFCRYYLWRRRAAQGPAPALVAFKLALLAQPVEGADDLAPVAA